MLAMRHSLALVLALVVGACSVDVPARWRALPYPKGKLSSVEETTDQHGLYLVYHRGDREQLLKEVETALMGAGYKNVGEALDGAVLGFAKGEDRLAVKVDQFGEKLYLAIFDEAGKEPLLHGVVFGKYRLGEAQTGADAKQQLIEESASR